MSQLASATVTTGNVKATSSLGKLQWPQHRQHSLLKEGRRTFLKGDYLHYTRHLLYVEVQLELDGAIHGDARHLYRERPTSSSVKPTFVWRALEKSNPLLCIIAALGATFQSNGLDHPEIHRSHHTQDQEGGWGFHQSTSIGQPSTGPQALRMTAHGGTALSPWSFAVCPLHLNAHRPVRVLHTAASRREHLPWDGLKAQS